LGGWITDNYSWRWVFYINVPVGALALAMVYHLVEDPPYLARLKKRLSGFDFIGFSLLTLGVGALQIALDKGQEEDWFGSHFITTFDCDRCRRLGFLSHLGMVSERACR
jgi:DHA2 family multidrug resistance protein